MAGSDTTRNTLVVVALPCENDIVNKVSSEKQAHLTLLYLGENVFDDSELAMVRDYIEHSASMLPRFGMVVERRGELGDDHADVLFFDKRYAKGISDFRSALLKNDLISKAYLSTEQFPEWSPHLTLGYPDNPAKKDERDYPGFSYVDFDRIALWTGDSEGPTFRLEDRDMSLEVAMSQTKRVYASVDDALAHFGVKGMKWGVRRSKAERAAHPHSEDSKAAADALQKVKVGGVKSLSNKELQALNARLNLEKQFGTLSQKTKSKGQKAVEEVLTNLGKQQASKVLGGIIDKGTAALLKAAGL